VGRIGQIRDKFAGEVEFFVVYVREAHPTDGWQVDANVQDEVFYRQHQTHEEREEVAQTCSLDLKITLPVLVEEMDNNIDEAFGAAPERLYLIGSDGKVAYHGGAGPFFFDLDEWEQAIQDCVDGGGTIKAPATTATAA
jgi:hypothetical protein